MKKYPWRELKVIEKAITCHLANGSIPPKKSVSELRRCLAMCKTDPNAKFAICFHGASACLAQINDDVSLALRHREIEAESISRAYDLETENPTDGWSLQNYQKDDISKRKKIMRLLKKKLKRA